MKKKLTLIALSSVLFFSCQPEAPYQDVIEENPDQVGVINGETVTKLQSKAAQSVVIVEMLTNGRERTRHCTGVLIGPQTVLTAAHCMSDKVVSGVVGFNIMFGTTTKYKGFPDRRNGFKFVNHPLYDTQKRSLVWTGERYLDPENQSGQNYDPSRLVSTPQQDHDLAVLVFRGQLPPGYAPVQIDKDATTNNAGKTVYFYGFGYSSDDLDPMDSNDSGQGQLRRGTAIIDRDYHRFKDRYFNSLSSKNSLCQGDSGGPQFLHENGVLKVIGINSAVSSDDQSIFIKNKPGLAPKVSCHSRAQVAKVAPFYSWIKETEKRLLKEMND